MQNYCREVFMRDDMKDQGYSKEDEYFHRKDRELIAKLKEKAEAERAKLQAENKKQEYWMRCPKCGSAMAEEKYGDLVLVDRCSNKSCGGIFFDGGELEMLLKAKSSLVQRIFRR
jgi:Zn-finger nucleic acid-binding protein